VSIKTGSPLEPVATSTEMPELMVIFSGVHDGFIGFSKGCYKHGYICWFHGGFNGV